MSKSQTSHAKNVVKSFCTHLSDEQKEVLGQETLDELSLMIESAICAAVLEELEKTAGQFDQLAHSVRRQAEQFEA